MRRARFHLRSPDHPRAQPAQIYPTSSSVVNPGSAVARAPLQAFARRELPRTSLNQIRADPARAAFASAHSVCGVEPHRSLGRRRGVERDRPDRSSPARGLTRCGGRAATGFRHAFFIAAHRVTRPLSAPCRCPQTQIVRLAPVFVFAGPALRCADHVREHERRMGLARRGSACRTGAPRGSDRATREPRNQEGGQARFQRLCQAHAPSASVCSNGLRERVSNFSKYSEPNKRSRCTARTVSKCFMRVLTPMINR